MNERVKTSSRYQSLCRCEENEHREMNFNSYSGPDGPPSSQRKQSPLPPPHQYTTTSSTPVTYSTSTPNSSTYSISTSRYEENEHREMKILLHKEEMSLPSNTLPSNTLPSNTLPSNTLPSNELP